MKAYELIYKEMKKQNLSKYKLAKLAGVDRGNLHKFLIGQTIRPTFQMIRNCFLVLELNPELIMKVEI